MRRTQKNIVVISAVHMCMCKQSGAKQNADEDHKENEALNLDRCKDCHHQIVIMLSSC